MELKESLWKFDESVANVFDDHVNKSVPFYKDIHETILNSLSWFIQEETNIYDIGSSTGSFLKKVQSKFYNKNINMYGIDESPYMIEKSYSDDINLICTDVINYNFNNASVITSILTLQFIKEKDRKNIIKNIYNGLNKGGCFILVEKVLAEDSKIQSIWDGMYHDLKIRNGFTSDEVIEKSRSIRGVMSPLKLSENIELLEQSGFANNEVIFKWCNFVAILCIK